MTEAARDHDVDVDCHGYGERPTFFRLLRVSSDRTWPSGKGITKGGRPDGVLGYFAVNAAGSFSTQLG